MRTFVIPEDVEEISKDCFAKCRDLEEVKNYQQIQHLTKQHFFKCDKLEELISTLPSEEKQTDEEKIKELLEIVQTNRNRIVFDSNKHDWDKSNSQFRMNLRNKNNYTIIVQSTNNDIFSFDKTVHSIPRQMHGMIQKSQTDKQTYFHIWRSDKLIEDFHLQKQIIPTIYQYDNINLFSFDSFFVIGNDNHKDISKINWSCLNESNQMIGNINFSQHVNQNNYNFIPQRILVVE